MSVLLSITGVNMVTILVNGQQVDVADLTPLLGGHRRTPVRETTSELNGGSSPLGDSFISGRSSFPCQRSDPDQCLLGLFTFEGVRAWRGLETLHQGPELKCQQPVLRAGAPK